MTRFSPPQTSSPATAVSTGPTGPGAAARRLSGLDGLRGLAVSLVVVFHLFPPLLGGGFIGVDVFFVISGFLITGLIVAERETTGRFSALRFWRRRARRLLPALVPLLLVCSSAAWLIGGDVLVGLGWKMLGAGTFSYNWVSLGADTSYFGTGQPELFRNLWSLAVEEQFYLIWPLLLLLLLQVRRPRVRLVVVLALAAASAGWMAGAYLPGADPTRVYYGSDTHSFGLLIGAALALLLRCRPAATAPKAPRRSVAWTRSAWGVVAVAGLIAAAVLLPDDAALTYRGGLVGVSLLAAVVIWAGVAGTWFGRMLDTAPLRYLGERSYGLYLWHWPLLVLVQLAVPAGRTPGGVIAAGLVTLVLAVGAAAASYRWLELPIRRLGLRAAFGRLWALAGAPVEPAALPASGITPAPARSRRSAMAILVVASVTTLALLAGATASVLLAPGVTSAQAEVLRGQQALARAQEAQAAQAAQDAADVAAGRAAPATLGATITAVGDSVMLASAGPLQDEFPGILIDAAVSRGMESAPEILTAHRDAGTLRDIVVLGLGTNGQIAAVDLAAIMRVLGPDRKLIVVNAFADRDWTAGVNAELADFSARRNRVVLADWHDAIAPHVDVLADDGIHPGPTGGGIYADAVAAALERLGDVEHLGDGPRTLSPGPDTMQAFRAR
jgi:peptidoglycan/LPS O-acetylase OafA/YrhL